MIKHISFDFWGTLFKSHPDYKIERAKIFFDHYNPKNKTLDEVNEIIRKVEKAVDSEAMFTMRHISWVNILYRISKELEFAIVQRDLLDMMDLLNQIFDKYPPVYYDEDTLNVLKQVYNRGRLYLTSNTGFIQGSKLEKHLSNLGISYLFNRKIFSDQINCYKPSSQMFNTTFANLAYDKDKQIHIGDSYAADGIGAENAGIKHIIINTNDLTIKDIPDLL